MLWKIYYESECLCLFVGELDIFFSSVSGSWINAI